MFERLNEKEKNPFLLPSSFFAESSGKEPNWNFWKYLIDVNGKVVDAWGPKVSVKELRPKIAEMVRQIIIKKKEEL